MAKKGKSAKKKLKLQNTLQKSPKKARQSLAKAFDAAVTEYQKLNGQVQKKGKKGQSNQSNDFLTDFLAGIVANVVSGFAARRLAARRVKK